MLDLSIRAKVFAERVIERAKAAARGEGGQTAAEYLGIIIFVAAVVAVLVTSDIGSDIVTAIKNAIARIAGGGGAGGGGGGGGS